MGPLIRIGSRALAHVSVIVLAVCSASAQNSPFNGRCQTSSDPLQVRAEGLAERMGDIQLTCSGSAPGTVFTGNLSLFFPVSVTNRVDALNLTRDAAIFIDIGR